MLAESTPPTPEQSQAKADVEAFTNRYGPAALEFACHAAFPLTLTTELAYCLRQKFCSEADWSVAPLFLLSDLCSGIGTDLYEIPIATRYCLLEELLDQQGEGRLFQIADFMAGYIKYRLDRAGDDWAKFHGQPPDWIALAMLKRDQELTEYIQNQLAERLKAGALSRKESLRLAAMIRGQGDLLTQRQLQPITLQQLAARVKQGEKIHPPDGLDDLRAKLRQAGFPELKTKQIHYATVCAEVDATQEDGELRPFAFETVTVNANGKIISRDQQQAMSYVETLPEGLNLEMVAIPSGKFLMGSPESEHERYDDEGDAQGQQHEVAVPPFFMGKFPVTQAQWRIVANLPPVDPEIDLQPAPSHFTGDNRPVEWISWREATEFCQRLSGATGRQYRLSSEAEWEYACRAGTTTPFYFGETITGNLANYASRYTYQKEKKVKYREGTTPVGIFPPNSFGLYDMHGNVFEWCQDHWHSNYEGAPTDGSAWLSEDDNQSYVYRGGSWIKYPRNCRSAYRNYGNPDDRDFNLGFRVVCCAP